MERPSWEPVDVIAGLLHPAQTDDAPLDDGDRPTARRAALLRPGGTGPKG